MDSQKVRIGGVDFPKPLITALRDGRLVIFAGAGVSMGHPACLPNFEQLACRVAKGTGKTRKKLEMPDQFLGRLEDADVDIRSRVVELLQPNSLKPTKLHQNLLRLYNKVQNVRIVTTNFDQLFEQATDNLFNPAPKVLEAPVLPLGERFQGIVHIHGSVSEPQEMVLTDRDFGRAYLTEADGWARRFLVDLFNNFTVLFVGYSHSDTIMTYLTPSLPKYDSYQRYALTKNEENNLERWRNWGIEPIPFSQSKSNDYSALDTAIEKLANHIQRNILGWKQEITDLAKNSPPSDIDKEPEDIIKYALTDPAMTRFFINVAESPGWIRWLDNRNCLDKLFTGENLSESDDLLADWLTDRFSGTHADELFLAIGRHNSKMNANFWHYLARKMQNDNEASLDQEMLSRWVFFLTNTVPTNEKGYALLLIAEHCAELGAMDGLLQIYDVMTASRQRIQPRPIWREDSESHVADFQLYFVGEGYTLKYIWEKCLQPNIEHIAESLLDSTTRRLKERHFILRSWRKAYREHDPDSLLRPTIESHEKYDHYHSIDTLVTIARECIEWLATKQVDIVRLWFERHANSEAPLLRRLAIHTLSVRTDLSSESKLDWLLNHIDLRDVSVRDELFKIAVEAYPEATQEKKERLIQAVLDYRWPKAEDTNEKILTAGHQFRWLAALSKADPDCSLAKQALDPILTRYPDFSVLELPEHQQPFTVSFKNITGKPSPWSVPAMLKQSPAEWLPQALAEDPKEHLIDPRDELIDKVEEATRENSEWSLTLAYHMIKQGAWITHIWRGMIRAWRTMELDENEMEKIIEFLSCKELLLEHGQEIANALHEIIGENKAVPNKDTLNLANNIAKELWGCILSNNNISSSDWLIQAINHPAGNLTLFWIKSIIIWRKQHQEIIYSIDEKYQSQLMSIIQDKTVWGKFGRTVLASQFHVMLSVDEKWTMNNLLPFFKIEHTEFERAWDGFLIWGRITPQVADLFYLHRIFIEAIQRIKDELSGNRQGRFIEYYTAMLGRFVSDANDTWISEFFNYSDEKIRHRFAEVISRNLHSMNEMQQREC